MTNPPVARLCFITEPSTGVYHLNLSFEASQDRIIDVQLDGSRHERVRITKAHLDGLVLKATPMALAGAK